MEIINRPDYTEKVERLFGKGLIIALTGQRRVGKSFIMKQIINNLMPIEENNVIYIDKDDERFGFIKSHVELTDYIENHLVGGKNNFLRGIFHCLGLAGGLCRMLTVKGFDLNVDL